MHIDERKPTLNSVNQSLETNQIKSKPNFLVDNQIHNPSALTITSQLQKKDTDNTQQKGISSELQNLKVDDSKAAVSDSIKKKSSAAANDDIDDEIGEDYSDNYEFEDDSDEGE